uniref:Uncharacterized protein n=1 Tax=Glossina austeni TaxID=7395 RepID=A0A1A9V9L7_GLOAU
MSKKRLVNATAAASSAAELPGPVRGIPPTGPLVDGPPAAQVWAREYISVAVPAPPPGAPVGPAELGGMFQAFQLPPPDGPEGPPVENLDVNLPQVQQLLIDIAALSVFIC